MKRADALPAAGRGRRLAISSNRRSSRILFEILREVQRIELGEDLEAELAIEFNLLRSKPAATNPNGINALIRGFDTAVKQFPGIPAIDTSNRDPGAGSDLKHGLLLG